MEHSLESEYLLMECKKDQIYGELRRMIMDNLLPSGTRLPREVELARKMGVGHVTLRSALARLEAEGLIERIRSRGTFVTEQSRRITFLMILPDGMENLDTPSRYILAGVEAYAEQHCITIERCPASLFLSMSPKQRQEIKKRLQMRGVIFETGHRRVDPRLVSALLELELPVVIPHGLASDADAGGFLVLRTDERAAFSDAYRFLASQGHTRVAGLFLDIPDENTGLIRGFRREELSDFLRSAGLDSSDSLIAVVPNENDRILAAVRGWMSGPNPPTALLCHSDRIAMRVYFMLQEMNIRIPEQVSVMGYSNYPGSQLIDPPLTTIDTLLKECARIALEKLLNSSSAPSGGTMPAEIFTPHQLIRRESVVPPPVSGIPPA